MQYIYNTSNINVHIYNYCDSIYIYSYSKLGKILYTVNLVIYATKKINFVLLTKILFMLNNIYANQIACQSTCMKSYIFARSYL